MKKIIALFIFGLALTFLSLAGCKIRITVPEGGNVTTESGSHDCRSGQVCTIDVYDVFFDETFIGVPNSGNKFLAWKKRQGGLCGGKAKPCRLSTTGFPGNEGLMKILESDRTFYLEPIFAKPGVDTSLKKTVDNNSPDGSEVVNFTIEVTNIGQDAASEVEVTDLLPPSMRIPAGLDAYTSTGEYDRETGQWVVGELPSGATETLKLPAQIHVSPQPDCVVNSAVVSAYGDRDWRNDTSRSLLKRPPDGICGDLNPRLVYINTAPPNCGRRRVEYKVRVKNWGPDTVHSIVLKAVETAWKAPGFKFGNVCGRLTCNIGALESREYYDIWAYSDWFYNGQRRTHSVTFKISGKEFDQIEENNIRTISRTLAPWKKRCYVGCSQNDPDC